MFSRIRFTALACVLAAVPAVGAFAHEAGDWLVKGGVSAVLPKSGNGSVLGGAASLDVGNSTRPSISATYMATRNVGVELLAAVPFRHTISASGAVAGDIASTRQLPPTLSVQWYFMPDAAVQPYVGVGLNYTRFFDTRTQGALAGNRLDLGDSWGVALQAGVDVKLGERWFVNASLRYIDISSKVRLNGTEIGKARIDPWVPTIAVGYRF
ncbi:Outer membrane protein W precursor [Pigmentiphaga humi]|uniref:Outer membrane protein W n=1 Tax=Pigmentiphaga humi TaxID=2478468 RepID=A0A3P4BA59_9BURK|nr:OmpW family outer membrane protein [Pigmentiphaga humi]VCU72618.1 Outer membrane protein W precursor [Pigmentiphaga humi]